MPEDKTTKNRKQLGRSKNGIAIWYDTVSSHAATHIADTPNLKSLAKEVIEQTNLEGTYIQFDTDLGRIVGTSDLVINDESDTVIYAKRLNRDTYPIFNISKGPSHLHLL